MHYSKFMEIGQPLYQTLHYWLRLFQWYTMRKIDSLQEIASIELLSDDIKRSVRLKNAVYFKYVGMF